jgi:phytoene dehydrogenase-like protein
MAKYDVLIIGAGLSGLCCARKVIEHGYTVLVIEASDGVGGRVRTDNFNGFLLDRGFQVLQTAYPESQRLLNYSALDLRSFYPGALTRFDGRFHRIADPWRRPTDALKTSFSSVGSLSDKLKIALLRRRVLSCSLEELYTRPETTTIEALQNSGFSDRIIERFFRPFLAGVFFDAELEVSSRAFEFVFWAFAAGDTSLPAKGMGTIPQQMLTHLPVESVRTQTRVSSIDERIVVLAEGERISAHIVVVATDGLEAARLLKAPQQLGFRGTTCLYFAAREAPIKEPVLILNGEDVKPINSVVIPSNVSSAYAPAGQSLITVNVLGIPEQNEEELVYLVRGQLAQWFGDDVRSWEHLRTYRIRGALPSQTPPVKFPGKIHTRVNPWLFVCGDYDNAASIQWAMVSGTRAAQDVIEALHS